MMVGFIVGNTVRIFSTKQIIPSCTEIILPLPHEKIIPSNVLSTPLGKLQLCEVGDQVLVKIFNFFCHLVEVFSRWGDKANKLSSQQIFLSSFFSCRLVFWVKAGDGFGCFSTPPSLVWTSEIIHHVMYAPDHMRERDLVLRSWRSILTLCWS